MEVLIIKINNTTDEVQDIDLDKLDKFTFGVELSAEVKEISMLVDGLKIVTSSGGKVDSCFLNKEIVINEVEVYVPEWFSLSQHTNDYVNIKFLVDYFDSICFEINPRKRIEIYIPIDKCNLEFYKNLKIQAK